MNKPVTVPTPGQAWDIKNQIQTAAFRSSCRPEKTDRQTDHWASLVVQVKESTCQCRRRGFDPWSGKSPYFQSLQKLSKAGFTVPGARPASGQCEATLGVLRWPPVCGKSSPASSWISLLGNSSIDQVSELMTCDGDVGEKMKVRTGRFILNTLFPHSLLHIHSFDLHIFTEQLLCVRCCHKSWG